MKTQSFAAGLVLAVLFAAGTTQAADADVAALEARVAELEALVKQLVGSKDMPAPAPAAVAAKDESGPKSTYAFGGYVKFDATASDYSGGDLAPSSLGTQFYVPGTIPVGGTTSNDYDLNTQGRETRINFKSDHVLGSGDKISTFIELDFFLSPGGNERVSNSYNPRMRHAFFKYNKWLFGQTWSTFQDVAALPENLDFVGPAESTVFIRQPMIRYTNGPWELAVENPETTITPFGGGSRIVSDDGSLPDFVARYTAKLDNGYIKAAGLVRQLSYKTDTIDDEEMSFGISVSGKHMFGEDDIRWMATYGSGTGRYLGLNTSNGAVLDASGNLNAIDQWGAFVSYRHWWDSQWRSNFTFGYLDNDNDTALTGTGVTADVYSIHANLLYSPVPKMTVGGEIIYAERTLESDLDGDMTRLMFSAKYAF
ncbi:MAG: DcaP family trimeric outer membrane transporter [Woeseiaceae bacterium]|nr:DcaP family trimeric outer membrane transporter [Woeseiaceae bacterium]